MDVEKNKNFSLTKDVIITHGTLGADALVLCTQGDASVRLLVFFSAIFIY